MLIRHIETTILLFKHVLYIMEQTTQNAQEVFVWRFGS